MSWATSTTDLRRLLSDGSTDKLKHRKRVLGQINGANTVFKTFEFRRVTDLSTATAPFGVYVDGSAVAVSSDDLSVGEFTLASAPLDGSVVEATYYNQWFNDSELDGFLLSAANWLGFASASAIVEGLRPAAIHYAAQEAYMKLSLRWAEHLSETYRLEDAPADQTMDVVESYKDLAEFMHKKSVDLRDQFYTRQGRNLQPISTSILGNVRDVVPKR